MTLLHIYRTQQLYHLNIPKTKWDGAEEPTINNFFKIDRTKLYEYHTSSILKEFDKSIYMYFVRSEKN